MGKKCTQVYLSVKGTQSTLSSVHHPFMYPSIHLPTTCLFQCIIYVCLSSHASIKHLCEAERGETILKKVNSFAM